MKREVFSTVERNLRKKGYIVKCFDTALEAADYIEASISNETIGFGGSMTLEKMGLYERLSKRNTVYWHQRIPEGKTDIDVRVEANAANIYISSVNGLAETGEIINIDGNCNRVASIFYGHEKVYLVIGVNKLEKDYDRALYRARNVASPLNAKRFGVKTPCAVKADKCYDCKSPERICRGLSVLWSKPMTGEFEVILIDEELGYKKGMAVSYWSSATLGFWMFSTSLIVLFSAKRRCAANKAGIFIEIGTAGRMIRFIEEIGNESTGFNRKYSRFEAYIRAWIKHLYRI